MSEKIYGRKPVLESIRSGNRTITHIYLLQGSRDGVLNQIESHAKARGIPIGLETRHRMDTMAGTEHHQGVIAVAEDYKYADLQDILDAARKKMNQPLFFYWMKLRTRIIWARFFARQTRLEFME